ncbi:phosphodiesterase [Streptomyces alfalfae]|uniref:Phosphodiesterase n=1 Tax=Streptomyces alfalfae TaxID=1642299 RepID=A0A7T4PC90_9ACTN|nr:phosphodiesterase [Streptomyces alfalfae]QQC87606.1 phosphodiesterase [Streptomyces alfalfae]
MSVPRPVAAGAGLVARAARTAARRRRAPALHPRGVCAEATLAVHPAGGAWGEPWLDEPGDHRVRLRWSRGAGLPGRLPDALGLALRVDDAGGPGRPLDLLLTSSGGGRVSRRLPLPRLDATGGPYSTLLPYHIGRRRGLLIAHPSGASPHVPSGLPALRTALERAPLTFHLCAALPGGAWWHLGTLTTGTPLDLPPGETLSYDPYLHCLPGLRPTAGFSTVREAAYAASRAGRHTTEGTRTPAC